MKRILLVLAIALMAAPVMADYYLAGDFNGWNAAGNIMTDLGNNVWKIDLTLGANERHAFKVTIGDWSANYPASGNSWFYTDANGNTTITYDTNTYTDGWSKDTQRIGVSTDPGAWTAVGDWQGWNNADSATTMIAQGGGLYKYSQALAPGWYQYKAIKTGTWDAIGADGRSENADTLWFETTESSPTAIFWVNALNGTIKVDVVPEPASILTLVAGLPVLALFKKRSY